MARLGLGTTAQQIGIKPSPSQIYKQRQKAEAEAEAQSQAQAEYEAAQAAYNIQRAEYDKQAEINRLLQRYAEKGSFGAGAADFIKSLSPEEQTAFHKAAKSIAYSSAKAQAYSAVQQGAVSDVYKLEATGLLPASATAGIKWQQEYGDPFVQKMATDQYYTQAFKSATTAPKTVLSPYLTQKEVVYGKDYTTTGFKIRREISEQLGFGGKGLYTSSGIIRPITGPFIAFKEALSQSGGELKSIGTKQKSNVLKYGAIGTGVAFNVASEFVPTNPIEFGAYYGIGKAFKYAPKITSMVFGGYGLYGLTKAETPEEYVTAGLTMAAPIGAYGARRIGIFKELWKYEKELKVNEPAKYKEYIKARTEARKLAGVQPPTKALDLSRLALLEGKTGAQTATIKFFKSKGRFAIVGGSISQEAQLYGVKTKRPGDIDVYVRGWFQESRTKSYAKQLSKELRGQGIAARTRGAKVTIGGEKFAEFHPYETYLKANIEQVTPIWKLPSFGITRSGEGIPILKASIQLPRKLIGGYLEPYMTGKTRLKDIPAAAAISKSLWRTKNIQDWGMLGKGTVRLKPTTYARFLYLKGKLNLGVYEYNFEEKTPLAFFQPGKKPTIGVSSIIGNKKLTGYSKQEILAHELLHHKTPKSIRNIGHEQLPYKLQPAEIISFGLQKFYARRGFAVPKEQLAGLGKISKRKIKTKLINTEEMFGLKQKGLYTMQTTSLLKQRKTGGGLPSFKGTSYTYYKPTSRSIVPPVSDYYKRKKPSGFYYPPMMQKSFGYKPVSYKETPYKPSNYGPTTYKPTTRTPMPYQPEKYSPISSKPTAYISATARFRMPVRKETGRIKFYGTKTKEKKIFPKSYFKLRRTPSLVGVAQPVFSTKFGKFESSGLTIRPVIISGKRRRRRKKR